MSKAKNPFPSMDKRRRFDPAFQCEAVELGRRIGILQAAADLRISESRKR